MKRFLLIVLLYGAALALSLTIGGLYITPSSLTPLFMAGAAVFTALVFRRREAPMTMNIPESADVVLTDEEKHVMLFCASRTLWLSVPLELLLVCTWHPFVKAPFSVLLYCGALVVGLHLGRRRIREGVSARIPAPEREHHR